MRNAVVGAALAIAAALAAPGSSAAVDYSTARFGQSTNPDQVVAVMLYVHSLMGDGRPGELDPADAGPGVPARPSGPSVRVDEGAAGVLNEVAAVLADRRAHPREGSYATRLFADGLARLNEKIMEEAAEVTRAARKETRERLVEETADLWFHSLALLVFLGARPDEVFTELARRRR